MRHIYHYYISYNEFSASDIIDNIYIGNVYDAHNIDRLNELNIKNVISAVTGFDNIYDDSFNHLSLNLIDNENQDIIHYFEITNHYLDNIISKNISSSSEKNKHKILIHCICGVSRSVTILLAYIIKKYNYTPKYALKIVQKKRNIANPNDNFMKQLWTYYENINK
jgi:protein-tyrosine phosphatase|tara:strand:+ start:128 stop:625 length:498 start_codon:yes stop_codon:yes gene_type:complete